MVVFNTPPFLVGCEDELIGLGQISAEQMQFACGAILVNEDVSTNQDGSFNRPDVDLPQVAWIQAQCADFDEFSISSIRLGESHLEIGFYGTDQVLFDREHVVDVFGIGKPAVAKDECEFDRVLVGSAKQVTEHFVLGALGAPAFLAGLDEALQGLEYQFEAYGELDAVAAVEQTDKVDTVDIAVLTVVVMRAYQAIGICVGLLTDAVVNNE